MWWSSNWKRSQFHLVVEVKQQTPWFLEPLVDAGCSLSWSLPGTPTTRLCVRCYYYSYFGPEETEVHRVRQTIVLQSPQPDFLMLSQHWIIETGVSSHCFVNTLVWFLCLSGTWALREVRLCQRRLPSSHSKPAATLELAGHFRDCPRSGHPPQMQWRRLPLWGLNHVQLQNMRTLEFHVDYGQRWKLAKMVLIPAVPLLTLTW